ncbi:MAG: hypothetical protein ACKOEC_12495 [Acidimicrobiia bacterium]
MSATSRALAMASRWFDGATVDRVFAPLVADWQREWIEAPPSRQLWILARGVIAFAATFIMLAPRILTMSIPTKVWQSVFTRGLKCAAITCGLASIPLLLSLGGTTAERRVLLTLYVMPSVLVFGVTIAAVFTVNSIRRGPAVAHRERVAVAQLALACALFTFTFGGWVVPSFSARLRQETVGELPDSARGVRELTTRELILDPTSAAAYEPYTGGRDRGTRINEELHNRAYAVLLPVLLVWLRWQALAVPRRGWLPLAPSAAAVANAVTITVLLLGMWQLGIALELRSGVSNWLSAGTLVTWGLLAPLRRRVFAETTREPA